jgi:hypothetical protein
MSSKPIRIKTKVLPLDIYHDRIILVWPVTPEAAKKWCKKKGFNDLEPMDATDAAATYRVDGGSVLMLSSWDTDINHMSLIAHEAIHISSDILREKGVKEVDGQEEAMAYLVGLIMRQLLKALTGLKG